VSGVGGAAWGWPEQRGREEGRAGCLGCGEQVERPGDGPDRGGGRKGVQGALGAVSGWRCGVRAVQRCACGGIQERRKGSRPLYLALPGQVG
jgi:hypothetical protein